MTTQEIKNEIEKIKAQGCKLSDDKIEAIIVKRETNKQKNKKRTDKGFARRQQAEVLSQQPSVYGNMTMSEINLMNAKNNLPSSMR